MGEISVTLIYGGPFRLRFLIPLFYYWHFKVEHSSSLLVVLGIFFPVTMYIIAPIKQNDVIDIFHVYIFVFAHFLTLFCPDTDSLVKKSFYLYWLQLSGWQLLFYLENIILQSCWHPVTVHLLCNSQHHLPCIPFKEWHIFLRELWEWELT